MSGLAWTIVIVGRWVAIGFVGRWLQHRELGVSEGNAQRAERDGIVPANVSTRAAERFLAL